MDRVTEELEVYLNASCTGSLCVKIKNYDTVLDDIKSYVAQPDVKVWIGTEYTNYALYEIITPVVCLFIILFTICVISLRRDSAPPLLVVSLLVNTLTYMHLCTYSIRIFCIAVLLLY